MDYIVSPSFVYLLSVSNNLRELCIVLAVILAIAVGVVAIIAYASWDYGKDYGEDDPDFKRYLSMKKVLKILIPSLIVTSLMAILFPNKNTLIEIKVASLLTKENVNLTVEAVKETIDYIIEAISKIK